MSPSQPVMRLADLWEGDLQRCEWRGRKLLLARVDGRVHAYEDRCPHLGAALSAGHLADGVLTCAMHHWQFDLRTGAGVNPASARLSPQPVSVIDGQICIAEVCQPPEAAHESG